MRYSSAAAQICTTRLCCNRRRRVGAHMRSVSLQLPGSVVGRPCSTRAQPR